MFDIIELIFNLFTEPVTAVVTIILVPALVIVLYGLGRRAGSRWPLDQPPEMVVRHMLKFTEDDLAYNRKGRISPAQHQLYRREVMVLIVVAVVVTLFMVFITGLFAASSSRMMGFRIALGVVVAGLMAGVFGWLIRRYVRDLRAGSVLTLITRWELEQHVGDFMLIPVRTRDFKLVVRHPALTEPLKLRLGFLSPAAHAHLATLNGEMTLLYITARASRLLACEIIRDPHRVAALEKLQRQSKPANSDEIGKLTP